MTHTIPVSLDIAEKADQLSVLNRKLETPLSLDQEPNPEAKVRPLRAIDGPRGVHLLPKEPASLAFPMPLTVAAGWDPDLAYRLGKSIAAQLDHYGIHQLYAPGLNLIADPRAGRNAEYYSEDPVLTGHMAGQFARGIEDGGHVATLKHFCCNDFETGRFFIDITVPERPLRELHLLAFEIALRISRARAVMTAYNSVNGHFCAANARLLQILRDELGFDGIVISDWGANMESTTAALAAGCHLDMPGHRFYSAPPIQKALDSGELDPALLDRVVDEVLGFKSRLGLLGDPAPAKPAPAIDREAVRALSREASASGIVLLKNAGILPLRPEAARSFTLLGPMADSDEILGNQGSSTVHVKRVVRTSEALEAAFPDARIETVGGMGFNDYPGSEWKNDLRWEAAYFDNRSLSGAAVIKRTESALRFRPFVTEQKIGISRNDFGAAWCLGGASVLRLDHPDCLGDETDFTLAFRLFLSDQFPAENNACLTVVLGDHCILVQTPKAVCFFDPLSPAHRSRAAVPRLHPQAWCHILWRVSGDGVGVFINGTSCGTVRIDRSHWKQARIHLGGDPLSSIGLPCEIGDIRLFDTALSDDQVDGLFATGQAVTEPCFHENCEQPPVVNDPALLHGISDTVDFSARFETDFTPDHSGKYGFRIEAADGCRFLIDGRRLINSPFQNDLNGRFHYAWPQMEAGRSYRLSIEYLGARPQGYAEFRYCAPPPPEVFTPAIQAAANAETAILCVGVPAEAMQGEACDLDTFALPGWQDEWIEAVAKANPDTVVVLHTAGGVPMPWLDRVAAVLEAWYPGEDGGLALVDVLSGLRCPGGKLPLTFPADPTQLDPEFPRTEYPDSLCAFGYRHFEHAALPPLFPFGHGLSYTEFALSDFAISECQAGGPWEPCLRVELTIRNTGPMQGSETLQLYLSPAPDLPADPPKTLRAFQRVTLDPDATLTVGLTLCPRDFARWNPDSRTWRIASGPRTLYLGTSSRAIHFTSKIHPPDSL